MLKYCRGPSGSVVPEIKKAILVGSAMVTKMASIEDHGEDMLKLHQVLHILSHITLNILDIFALNCFSFISD